MTPGADSRPKTAEPSPRPVRMFLKRQLAGRMAAALWRKRRVPSGAARAWRAERDDRRAGRVPPPVKRRRDARGVLCIPAGPGDPELLFDTIDSIRASDGEDSVILVVDDCSVALRESVVRARHPDVEVIRTRRPSGGLPNIWPPLRAGMVHALAHYDFELFAKFDTDALCCGQGFTDRCLQAFAAHPGTGLGGSFGIRADGEPEDRSYHAGVLTTEARRDPQLRKALALAEANGWQRGDTVQGGVSVYTREAVRELSEQGWLDWKRPWHSNVAEDAAVTVFVRACGLGALSLGAPSDGVLAVAARGLPLAVEELADGPWVATHSTRVGLHGESEQELRAAFRERRAQWPDLSVSAARSATR